MLTHSYRKEAPFIEPQQQEVEGKNAPHQPFERNEKVKSSGCCGVTKISEEE
jgi:hypothetical protein